MYILINDSTNNDIIYPDRTLYGRNTVPRDYSVQPVEMFDAPDKIPLIPRSEWQARIQEQEEKQSSLEHIWRRQATKLGVAAGSIHLDQNGQGFCWAYSIGHTIMMARCRDNQPFVRLSPHGVACQIKSFRDEGGWCGLSAQFAREKGYPTVETWKEKSMSRSNLTEEMKNESLQYRITEDWVDLTRPVWGQNLTYDQVITCLLMNIPCALDFNWWSHSVMGCRAIWKSGRAIPRILNSWAGWGDDGFADIEGDRAVPDGAVATRAVIAA